MNPDKEQIIDPGKEQKTNPDKEQKMSPGIIKAIAEAVKSVADLGTNVVESADSEKYAKSLNEFHKGVEENYSLMRNLINNDESLSTDEKLKRLEDVAQKEADAKKNYGESIRKDREHVTETVMNVVGGFLTCGAYLAPSIIKNIKNAVNGKDEVYIEELKELNNKNLSNAEAKIIKD
jgi:ATP-dependent DNA ligase